MAHHDDVHMTGVEGGAAVPGGGGPRQRQHDAKFDDLFKVVSVFKVVDSQVLYFH